MKVSGVKVTFDRKAVMAKVGADLNRALPVVTNELLKDSNFYARKDTGDLIESSIKHSDPGKGVIRWHTPYARKMYYTGNPVQDKNPNASLMWAHKASAENKDKYRQMIQDIINSKRS